MQNGTHMPERLAALTSVRIFLAVGVVLFHLSLAWTLDDRAWTSLIERARLGVDVFFILSGFVLAHVYSAALAAGQYSHREFLAARIARIYPAHLAVLALMLAMAAAAFVLGERLDPTRYSAWGFVQTLFLTHAWLPTTGVVEWNGPSWSLSAEWGAYLAFPLFARAGLALRERPLVLLALSAILFAVLDMGYTAAFGTPLIHAEFNLGVLRLAPEFLAGVALFHLVARTRTSPVRAMAGAFAATTFLVALMHIGADERLIVAASGVLIASLALVSKAGADGWLANPTLLRLGEASYAVYLLHLPVMTLWKNAHAAIFGGESAYVLSMAEAGGILALTVGGALAIHALWEQPVRRLIRRWAAAGLPARQGPITA